ncbi:MAG TPA: hypothetical protein VKU00_34420, partial [Chthonomonadaceae bacterium]|nr:hypothetical protein [Chthonomonadaceae bacterium]
AEIRYGGQDTNEARSGYRYYRIFLEAKFDHDETRYVTRLSLPASLPDDRRDKTRVELIK